MLVYSYVSLENGVQRYFLNFNISYFREWDCKADGQKFRFKSFSVVGRLRRSMLHFKREMFKILFKIGSINRV